MWAATSAASGLAREAQLPSLAVLIAALALGALAAALLVRFLPALIPGPEVTWLIQTLLRRRRPLPLADPATPNAPKP